MYKRYLHRGRGYNVFSAVACNFTSKRVKRSFSLKLQPHKVKVVIDQKIFQLRSAQVTGFPPVKVCLMMEITFMLRGHLICRNCCQFCPTLLNPLHSQISQTLSQNYPTDVFFNKKTLCCEEGAIKLIES